MRAAVVVVLVVVAVIVAVMVLGRGASAKKVEMRRLEAGEHRETARAPQLESDRAAAEAKERAARATQEAAAAEQHAMDARRTRGESADLEALAREVGPDEPGAPDDRRT